jgi:dTDP-4-amino-4,6-dideoxygalactose transaminase
LLALHATCFGEPELHRVSAALAGRVAGDGPFGRRVESRLEQRLAASRVLLTTSGTHALELALLALGVGHGDEVVCPSFTFASTANAVLRVGARPVFADIEERTLGLDLVDVERRLTPRTRALLPVHYGGLAADLAGLRDIAAAYSLLLVEDAAHALGGAYRGQSLGTIGDAGCFSFHETKGLTCGEGGAVAFIDPGRAAEAEIIREKGTNRSAFLRGEIARYTWIREGSSYVLADVLAAILDAQLDRFEELQRVRAAVVAQYREGLGAWARQHGVRLPAELPDRVSAHQIFHLLLPRPELRDPLLARLREAGIGASFHYLPLHSSPAGRSLGAAQDLPVTDRVAATLVRLPLHPLLSEDDVARVLRAVVTALP